jgi:hypothetical protein
MTQLRAKEVTEKDEFDDEERWGDARSKQCTTETTVQAIALKIITTIAVASDRGVRRIIFGRCQSCSRRCAPADERSTSLTHISERASRDGYFSWALNRA